MEKKRVLVIDDAEVFQEIMKEALSDKGLEVASASDGMEALDALARDNFDLVLLDLLLPRMTGFDLLREIKKAEKTAALPVLAVSGVYGKDEHIHSLRELGAAGFVSKGLSPEEIANRVERTIQIKGQARKEAPVEKPKPKAAGEDPLAGMQLFRYLDKADREKMMKISRRQSFAPGQVIIKEGEEGDKFYGILSGRVLVEKKDLSGNPAIIARLGPGDGFGELALIDNEKRSATCSAEAQVEALEISRKEFKALLQSDKEMERKCLRGMVLLLAGRLRSTDTSLTFSRSLLGRVSKPAGS